MKMESNMSLKKKMARLFKASILLRSPCNYSAATNTSSSIFSSSATGTASSRMSLNDIAIDPVFRPRNNNFTHNRPSIDKVDNINPPLFLHGNIDRSLSLPLRPGQLQLDCGGCRPTRNSSEANLVKKINTGKKERRVRENGGTYETGEAEGRICPPVSPMSPKKNKKNYYHNSRCFEENKKTATKDRTTRKLLSNGYGFSSSSSDFFSSDSEEERNEEESENFFSSRSFSSDSSEFYHRPSSNANRKKKSKNKEKKFPGKPPTHRRVRSNQGFRPVVSLTAKEEAKEEEKRERKSSIPVTKRSNDPYVDFRESMVEMIVERQIFGAKGLEKLLHSYLSLNSLHHHPVILRAFADISEVLFGH